MTVNEFHLGATEVDNDMRSLSTLLNDGEPYGLAFGGQGVPWLPALAELVIDAELESPLREALDAAGHMVRPVTDRLAVSRTLRFDPLSWLRGFDAGEDMPAQHVLSEAALSVPGIVLAQLAALRSIRAQGLDLSNSVVVLGHSQGILASAAVAADPTVESDARLLAIAQLIGAAGSVAAHRQGLAANGSGSPMRSIVGVNPERISDILGEFNDSREVDAKVAPVIGLRNGRRSVVVCGRPTDLAAFALHCQRLADHDADIRKRKLTGGTGFAPTVDTVASSIAFHHPGLAGGVELAAEWAGRCGLDVEYVRSLAAAVLTEPVDWVAQLNPVRGRIRWLLDVGPSDAVTRLSAPVLRGQGIGLIAAATRGGQRNLFSPGGIPQVATPWAAYAPRLVELPGGRRVVETAFTRLTGRSPILLAGMTPTTVDPAIVAAAANAGHWAELAGGGQVTEAIFADNVATLTELLDDGRQAQFNALYLDPYLWKLQLGGKKLVQKARAAGAPLDGVVVSAGIPELEEAVELVNELVDANIPFIAFKPGTVDHIRAVIRIAAEIPKQKLIVQIEGGRAGGHHSWEDLDDLLLSTYGELRARSNIVICVGGGIGTPERAAEYLTGSWACVHGYPDMPLDGILIGTAAMATQEATTSPQVKQLLVETTGCGDWVGAGHAEGGMASGRSQLGADIHEIDNAASRCGRLLDEVAGDRDAVAERRDEIVAALAETAKPYFGDLESMTYTQWLTRYIELAVGDIVEAPVWIDITWQERYRDMLQRAEARLHPADRGEIATLFDNLATTDDPVAALYALVSVHPSADTDIVHPADVAFFLRLCRTPGKPVNFVPIIDSDVRRWWRSDSLWQAHDSRYPADAVCVIPGPVAVAGITRADEPVGDLLDRFESAVAERLTGPAEPADSRRIGTRGITGPAVQCISNSAIWWAGRLVPNPTALLGVNAEWVCDDKGGSCHRPSGATLSPIPGGVRLAVPVSGVDVAIDMELDDTIVDGGCPRVTTDSAASAMMTILTVAAGGQLAAVDSGGVATDVVDWRPDRGADHRTVTSATLPSELVTGGRRSGPVCDAIVGLAWPAVFAVIGAARTDDGTPVAEGLLNLVHLDHAISLRQALPDVDAQLGVRAQVVQMRDTSVGRVVVVDVTITHQRRTLATCTERFAIRGRTGTADIPDPPRAGGAETGSSATRKLLRQVTITAPEQMAGFASVSGDHNPIHTDRNAARLAGLDDPIVHGMWLSAAAQQVVTAYDPRDPMSGGRSVIGWTARFMGMVGVGDSIRVRVDRVGLCDGADVVEVLCTVDGAPVMSATARLTPPKTVYAFPGQGIQSKGMGLAARSRSKAAREVWERADAHTRSALGFSIIAVVRDNPSSLTALGYTYTHPDGVLFLTQFTQVAMATLGVAQVAELKESGGFVADAITCGHSVGEYNALAACAGVLPLEAVLEVVFRRGLAMHHLVPRDDNGRSDYRMAAIRPSQFGVADADVIAFIDDVSEDSGEFLEVVNLNLRGSQYAIAGTVAGLRALETEIDCRRAQFGGRRAFIEVPGIDVPFHSTVLRDGVPDFRASLDELLPAAIDESVLIGRYIPNLVPRLFTLDRDFVVEIAQLVPSEPLNYILAEWESWRERPSELARVVLIELLAWQFASPVRWIETQDLLFADESVGGLAVERFVEVGVASAPTLTGLATNTLALDRYVDNGIQVSNLERDADVLLARDSSPDVDDDDIDETEEPDVRPTEPAGAEVIPATPAARGSARPDDIGCDPADAALALIALWTKIRPDQIGAADTIESLCDGVSSRRNQLLLDLGSELGLGAIDGAAEADMPALAATVNSLARGYTPLGPVLSEAVTDQIRKVLGPAGKRPGYVADRVQKVWQLGPGWVLNISIALALGTRDGMSVRGGELGALLDVAVDSAEAVDAVIDRAIAMVGAARGISVTKPSDGAHSTATVDAGALAEFAAGVTGPDGALASAAHAILRALGLSTTAEGESDSTGDQTELLRLLDNELGSDWPRLVAPAFDSRRAVVLDDRWATAREDLARLWLADDDEIDAEFDQIAARFDGAGQTVATQSSWWQGKALASGRRIHGRLFGAVAQLAENPDTGVYADDIAVVTGASRGSIAAGVVAELLAGGATVIATTSTLNGDRLRFFTGLYRDHARVGSQLWVVPANMASYADVDALVEWIASAQSENLGSTSVIVKPAMKPTLLFPFAAPRVAGDLTEAGPRAEMEMKVLLWSVERLIWDMASIDADHNIDSRMHVVLPGSPNRGMFGGDGAYGESKAALDAVVARWKAEESWNGKVTLVHAVIGWVRGTGLMGHNDGIVEAAEAAGVRTWTTTEMARELLALCTSDARNSARAEPLRADFTAGLDAASIDLKSIAAQVSESARDCTEPDDSQTPMIRALPSPARPQSVTAPDWAPVTAGLEDMVVIVGAGELGPYGSSRTRFEVEVSDRLSAAGVLELAWNTGLITWQQTPIPGWYDAESGDPVDESDIAERYHDTVMRRCGIRGYEDDGAMADKSAPLLTSVFLNEDLTFSVSSEDEARAFAAAAPDKTRIAAHPVTGEWSVTRLAGTEIRVPRRFALSRTVGGQIPSGFDPVRWGVTPDMVSAVDRVALWNLVATVDAFLAAGFDPSELMRWVHPGLVANTQGTGMGGMTSMRSLYIDTLLGESKANDILQEALPNVVAAHVVQSYIGSYGAMVHPVAACATAAVSVEEGVDKIRLGKALFAVAGGYDDLSIEGVVGFGDMSATADSAVMSAKGIDDRRFSRANDRRRSGFVESQGGGTILLARADVAARMGLPVLGVLGWAQSFGDGVHTSIPAPGIGALGVMRGAGSSPMVAALESLGVTADDVAFVSKHDTSTAANDPNEADLHERIAHAMGRSEGAPLFVVSQKTLTGHAKGGAGAFQLIGACQVLRSGIIPPNRSLDCVDEVMRPHRHLVWPTEALRFGDRYPLKAALVTSLGFGHVSGVIAVVHQAAFLAALNDDERAIYLRRSSERERQGAQRILEMMCGGRPGYGRPVGRRFGDDADEVDREASLLLDDQARLGDHDRYAPAGGPV